MHIELARQLEVAIFRKLLIPLDGSSLAERAIPHAAVLARKAGGRLLLLHVSSTDALDQRPTRELDVAAGIDSIAEKLQQAGLQATSLLSSGDPADRILEMAVRQQVDLIVMSTHGRSGLGRCIYGSVADRVLRRTPAPVLLLPVAQQRPWAEGQTIRIIVPLDGSSLAEAALGPACELADTFVGELLLVQVVQPLYDFDTLGFPRYAPASPDRLDEARAYLAGILSRPDMQARSASIYVDAGDPATEIANIARHERADVIAMATHGRTGLARLALGSIATGTLQRASVPVMVVRPATMRQEAYDLI